MPKFRSRTEVEAHQWTSEAAREIAAWCGGSYVGVIGSGPGRLRVPDVANDVPLGSWIVKTPTGIRVLSDDDFRAEFVEVEQTITEWGTLDRWYDDPEPQSHGTEADFPDAEDYARSDAERFGEHVVVVRREVTEWVEEDAEVPPEESLSDAAQTHFRPGDQVMVLSSSLGAGAMPPPPFGVRMDHPYTVERCFVDEFGVHRILLHKALFVHDAGRFVKVEDGSA